MAGQCRQMEQWQDCTVAVPPECEEDVEQRTWQAIFTVAHTDLQMMPFNNHSRTLRVVTLSNIETEELQVLFSNQCGKELLNIGAASVAICDRDGVLQPDTLVPITVDGVLAFGLEPGEERLSDRVRICLKPGDYYALNVYYPTATRVTSGNWMGENAQRSRPGNFSADLKLPPPGLVSRFARTAIVSGVTVASTTVRRVLARSAKPVRVVGCFGDSITQQGNWTEPFSRLLYHRYPGQISLCNLGISGNRLLADAPPMMNGLQGKAGVARFVHDLLELPGLTHAILALGTNDIGLPGSYGLPEEDVIMPEHYVLAMEQTAARLRQCGVRIYAATMTPRAINSIYTEAREALRQEINGWIRTAACFDAVLDFDAVLRREDGLPGMREGCALPDGLHPNPFGGVQLAKSIDLELFA